MPNNDDQEPYRAGLQPGMIVKNRAGLLKEVTRIEGDKVYWHFVDKLSDTVPEEMVTDYEEFADTHYVTPLRGGDQGKNA
jgi:hypothetical protein